MWPVVAALGGALFFLCAASRRGGLLGSAPYGDVHLYDLYGAEMAAGQWPYRRFLRRVPAARAAAIFVVVLLPGTYRAWRLDDGRLRRGGARPDGRVARVDRRVAAAARRRGGVIGRRRRCSSAVFIYTFDFWPALLTAASLLAFVRRRDRTAYVFLALAVSAKTYPIVLLPVALMATWDRGGRELVKRCLIWFVGVLFVVHLPFAIAGPGGLRFSYWVQLKRGLEVESLAAAPLLVLNRLGWHHIDSAARPPGRRRSPAGSRSARDRHDTRLARRAAVVYVLFWRRRRDPMILAWAAAVTALVAFSKSFSPQYVDWMLPLVPAAGAVASALLLVILGLTHIVLDRFKTPGGRTGALQGRADVVGARARSARRRALRAARGSARPAITSPEGARPRSRP